AAGKDALVAYNTVEKSGRLVLGIQYLESSEVKYNVLNGGLMAYLNDFGVLSAGQHDYGNTVVHHNIIYDNLGGGSVLAGIYPDNFTSNLIIHHNIVWNTGDAIRMNTPSEFNHVYNNTFIGKFVHWPSDSFYNTRYINNILTGSFQDHAEIYKLHNIDDTTNPMFTNAATHDYSLQSGSPAVDAGSVIPGITDGYAGAAPDLGALERGATDWRSSAGHNFTSPPAPTLAHPDIPFMNKVSNAGFEEKEALLGGDGLTGWTKTGAANAAVTDNVITGGYLVRNDEYGDALQLGGGIDGIEQTISGLTANTFYSLSGWLKSDAGETVVLGVKDFGNAETYQENTATTAGRYEMTFRTGPSATSAKIYVKKTSAGSGHAYADDLGLVEKTMPVNEGKIDLLGKYNTSQITVSTDMTYSHPSYPDIKVSGAFDGSTEYTHAAFKDPAAYPSTYTITLDKSYKIGKLGIALKIGYAESASVYFSADGTNWGSPVKSYTNATHTAIDYTTFSEPVPARYVKVVVTASVGLPGLNEIELYAPTDLLAKYNAGTVTVDTDMLWTDPSYPAAGISAAFDGSTEYFHSAYKSAMPYTPAHYTIALDRSYSVKLLGITLKPGYAESADIYFSSDGVNWGSPVKSYTNATHGNVDYTTFAAPASASYVKVNVTGCSCWAGLNEIELHEPIDLLGKYNSGQISVNTDMTWTDPGYPAAGVSSALDGNTAYFNSAYKDNAAYPSYYTVTLDKNYVVKGLGILLKNGYAESADVYFSTDGVNWGSPVKSYVNAVHTGVDTTIFADARIARYVKVVVSASSGWPGLNELQLYQ
ncbi:MAG: discoidin domain-containing protein, partial [Paenibacillaceae bacterium]|nr:discoidin domain-containing protein [Paenibacillaceae bacterium]